MLEQYAESKKYLLNFIKELENSPVIDPYILINSTLADEAERLDKGDFKIALVAPFTAGKSTFINSIIGKDLLSMDIRAETSVITKISFSENIKIEVSHRNSGRVDVIEADEQGQPLTYETCKLLLKKISTVRDETNEDKYSQIVVYCPLDICRDNVEIIDTPGLFSRHEKHEAITNNILPQVNAVIFMISPDSVGEEHFTDKIRNYVQSATSSNLEEDGRHIFFVINKIDMFNASEIQDARDELDIVLSGIIADPNVHEVSSYYGMKGKQLLNNDLDISEVQKDLKIRIPDPEDPEYMIGGRQLRREHASDMIQFSRIHSLEKSLGEYLQSKNKYLITDMISTIKSILSDSANRLKFEIKEIQSTMKEDNSGYLVKIDQLNAEIESLKDKTTKNIESIVRARIKGSINGESLDEEIEELVSGLLTDVTKDLGREIYKKWTKAKQKLTRDNAEDIVSTVILEAEEFLVLQVKDLVRESFLHIKKIISGLIGDIQHQLDLVTEQLEEAEIRKLGSKMDRIGNMNVDNMVGKTMNKIEREFSDILVSIAKDCQQKVQDADGASISEVKKAGVWNWFKGLFGKETYEEKFDMLRFKRELDVIINDMSESMANELGETQAMIAKPIYDMSQEIAGDINKEVSLIINNVVKIKQGVLMGLKKEMGKNENEKNAAVAQKFQDIKGINEIAGRFEHRIAQLMEGSEDDGLPSQGAVNQ